MKGTIVGWDRTHQPHAAQALRSAIAHDELGHAFLLVGPPGVGQGALARTLAAALNCPDASDGGPCGACETCRRVDRGTHTALVTFEPEGAMHLVDAVRHEWIPTASRTVAEGRRRVIHVVAADRMNESTQNAFLKILEEPPPSTIWVLEAADDTSLLDTVLSRCRRLDVVAWSPSSLAERARDLGVPEDRVDASVRASAGSPDRLAQLAARECPQCGRVYPPSDHAPAATTCDHHEHPVDTVPEKARDRHAEVVRRLADDGPGAVTPVVTEVAGWAKRCAAGLADAHAHEIGRLVEDYGVEQPRDLPRGVLARLERRHKRLQREASQVAFHRFLDDVGAYVRDLLVVHGGGADGDLVHVDHAARAHHDAIRLPPDGCLRALADINRCRNAITEFNGQPELQIERVLHPMAAALFATRPG